MFDVNKLRRYETTIKIFECILTFHEYRTGVNPENETAKMGTVLMEGTESYEIADI